MEWNGRSGGTYLQAPTARHSGVRWSRWGMMATLFGMVTEAPRRVSTPTPLNRDYMGETHRRSWDAAPAAGNGARRPSRA